MSRRSDSMPPGPQFPASADPNPPREAPGVNRRRFLHGGALAAAGLLSSPYHLEAAATPNHFSAGKFVRLVDFEDEGTAPVNTLIGSELDARLYTDLSRLSPTHTLTPASQFYVRTAASRLLPEAKGWQVQFDGTVEKPSRVAIGTLLTSAKPMGTQLMECAGNVRLTRFGLISVASWSGVPIADLIEKARPSAGAAWVEVSGFDEYSAESRSSIPGASWIFPMDALKTAGAFLATGMNGLPLTPDHGAPIRLVVPGWYGCACIKWVDRITLVDDGVEATTQMQEYAARTLQKGIPQYARDFDPATIDNAAMPVRVEQWTVAGKTRYRVIGIAWGGTQPATRLQIRFNPDEEYVTVENFQQRSTDPWAIWTHAWAPASPGTYNIQLVVAEPAVRARKLDSGYYVRTVTIRET